MRRFQTWPVIVGLWVLSAMILALGISQVVPLPGSSASTPDLGPTIEVWVARREIPAGRKLSGRDVRRTDWPEAYLPDQIAKDDPVGGFALSPIYAGEVLRTERIGSSPPGGER